MNYTYLHYQTALNLLVGIGPIRAKELITSVDSLEELFLESPRNLAKKTAYSAAFFKKMNRDSALALSDEILSYNQKHGIQSYFFTDQNYPERLRHCEDGPLMLHGLGEHDLNHGRFVAVVGTREATEYGRRLCEELISHFKDLNITVVSGLAYGIDSWAHFYACEQRVKTIAVLGHGLDRIYPARNRMLANKILQNGMLLTEFSPGTNPDKENFPKRNRIVAGLCDATIVIESKESGGSLITAELANDYNRDVFAFPGNIYQSTSQGCNALIKGDKAHLLMTPMDFLEKMNWVSERPPSPQQRKIFSNLSKRQISIVDVIAQEPDIHIDLLSLKVQLPMSELNSELFHLELEGAISCQPGKRYRAY